MLLTLKLYNMEAVILSKSDLAEIRKSLQEIKDHMKSVTSPAEHFINTDEFVKLMNVSHRTAQIWRDEGKIGYSQKGKKIYYRMSDIDGFLKHNYQAPHFEKEDSSAPDPE